MSRRRVPESESDQIFSLDVKWFWTVLAGAGVLFETLLRSATARFLPWYRRGEPGG
jgi:hypothetical protein